MKIVIIAGTHREAEDFINKMDFKPSRCNIVHTLTDLEGLNNIKVYSIGTCHELPEFTRMIDRCDAIRAVQPS